MKQRFVSLFLLAAAWFVMISCSADPPLGPPPEEASVPEKTAAQPAPAAEPAAKSGAAKMPKELRAAYIEARQREASKAYAARREGSGELVMDNPAHFFSTALDREEVVLSPKAETWFLSVNTTAFGCDGAELAVSEAEPEEEENRVRYPRDGFEEWYLNGPVGLEQGFSVDHPPACDGPKVIRWRAEGELDARLEDDDGDRRGESVRFVDEEGRVKARYTDLYVKDAAGKGLPAWLTVDKGEIAIHWEDAGAVYPVVVDPVFVTDVVELLADYGIVSKLLGTSVALSGSTAIVGAPLDRDKGQWAGAAYVFVNTGGTWTQQAKLTAPDGAVEDHFGESVAISGNTVLVGSYGDDEKAGLAGAAYVFVRSGVDWALQAKLTAADGAQLDLFGYSVAIEGDTALVGSYVDDDKGADSGSAYVFVRSGVTWTQQAKLTATDGAVNDRFGTSVALSTDTALVGAPDDDDKGSGSGSAYVFVRSGATWTQQAKLTAADGTSSVRLGTSVALSTDMALVGGNGSGPGYGYVFARSGVTWTQQAKLAAADGASGDRFGTSVALSTDTALVGAPLLSSQGLSPGYGYVFARSGVTWTQQAKLAAADNTVDDRFGGSVAFFGDTAIVGAELDDDRGASSGSAYVFVYNGGSWVYQTKLTAADGAAGDYFGSSVAVYGDTALVGAPLDDDKGSNSGSAYVFVRTTGGRWKQQAKLTATDGAANDQLGIELALSGDTALVGAPFDDDKGSSSGSAYVFVRNGTTWTQQSKLTAADGAASDQFGSSVALSGDTALIGAHEDDDKGFSSGSAYVFLQTGGIWAQQAKLLASTGTFGDQFGRSVALSGDTALVGAPYDNSVGGSHSGAAYIFQRTGGSWAQQARLAAANGVSGDLFGWSVAVSGDTAVVGASADDHNWVDAGSAYLFLRKGTVWTQQVQLSAPDGATSDQFGTSVQISDDPLTALIGAPYHDDQGLDSGSTYLFSLARSNGLPCAGATQCQSGFCVDGVCCDTPCNEVCKACTTALKGSGTDGYCGAAAAGTDPHNSCADSRATNPNSCGTDGLCSVSGVCSIYAYGTTCGANQCVAGSVQEQICNGFGACAVDPALDDCAPYQCQAGTCKTSCTGNQDCMSTAYCDTTTPPWKCLPDKALGATCTSTSQCQSGYCTDGVCCDTPCNGTCQACTAALKATGVNGFCGSAKEGSDPHSTCANSRATNPNSCGTDGFCSASGVCRVYAHGINCGANQCVGNSVQEQICNGLGACAVDPALDDCAPYQCQAGTCKTSCAANQDCAGDAFCDTTTLPGKCLPDKPLGEACSAVSQCQSGHCVDGVCCNTPCNGTCQACTATLQGAGTDGFCGPAAAGTDPHNTCADSRAADADSCGTDGLCSVSGVCRVYAYGTKCGANQCVAGSVQEQICNGFGACAVDPALDDCAPYQCEPGAGGGAEDGACKASCASDADCTADAFCDTTSLPGQCVLDKLAGVDCALASECQSGFCVDGVCCDGACAGECRFCGKDASDQAGVCHNAEDGKDPRDKCQDDGLNSCKQDGACNGAGLCRLYAYGEACGTAVCLGDLRYSKQICNGLGACAPDPGALESCQPYACVEADGESQCNTECASDLDCADGFGCKNDKCVPITTLCLNDDTSQDTDGTTTECAPYKCAQDTGECLHVCSSVDDCVSGSVCDETKTCVPPPSGETGDGCDCHVAGGGSRRPALPVALLITALLVLRRVQKKKPRRAPASPASPARQA